MRVWFLDETESVCPSCANGCNVKIGAARGQVYRLLPRRNDHVNDTWMCDAGRLGYRYVNETASARAADSRRARQRDGLVGRGARARHDGTRRPRPARRSAGASPRSSRRISPTRSSSRSASSSRAVSASSSVTSPSCEGAADDFLIKAEKAANARGARDLGLAGRSGRREPRRHSRRDRSRNHPRALRDRHGPLGDLGSRRGRAARTPRDPRRRGSERAPDARRLAHVVLPGLTFAEKNGTFTNHAGRVQRIHRALDPGHQPSDGEIFAAARPTSRHGSRPRTVRSRARSSRRSRATVRVAYGALTAGTPSAAHGVATADGSSGRITSSRSSDLARPRAMDTLGSSSRSCADSRVTDVALLPEPHGLHPRQAHRSSPVQYPEELQQLSPAFRGMPVLVQMANGKERCVACGLCEMGVSGRLHHDLPGRDRGRDRALSRGLRHRHVALHVLRPLRGGVPRGGDRHEPARCHRDHRMAGQRLAQA